MSSDGGALLLQAVDQRIGLTRRLAACFVDHRNPRRCEHSLQRLFGLALGYEDLCDHDRGHPLAGSSWSRKRRVVGQAEWLPGGVRGDNQRLVVTSLERGRIGTQPLYEQLYCARGDMENRIKEQQLDLFADRTSAATRRANQLRLYWALFAAALREVLRQRGLAGTELARAQCGTIRALLLKVAAVVRVSGGGSGCRCPRCFRARSCSRTAWRGCGRRRRDSLWASGRDSRDATRGGQREVCSPCANSPSRTGRVPRNRSRLTQIWLREGIPERQGREISCRPASNSPLPGPVTPKSEAA